MGGCLLEHLECSSAKIIMRGPIVRQLWVGSYGWTVMGGQLWVDSYGWAVTGGQLRVGSYGWEETEKERKGRKKRILIWISIFFHTLTFFVLFFCAASTLP